MGNSSSDTPANLIEVRSSMKRYFIGIRFATQQYKLHSSHSKLISFSIGLSGRAGTGEF